MKKDVSIIIVNYQTPRLVCNCLASIYKSQTKYSYEIIVIDNNSQDNSQAVITKKYPAVKVIAQKKNHGFAKANNLAAKKATGKYLLFLNSDTLVFPETIEKTIAKIKGTAAIGVLAPKVLNRDKSLQRSVYRFPSLKLFIADFFFLPLLGLFDDYRYFKHSKEKAVDFVIGAFMLVPAKLFKTLGGFDERFFMYAEESDFCLRVKKAGYNVIFYPETKIIHLGGASGKNTENINSVFERSKILYIKKNILFYRTALMVLGINYLIKTMVMLFSKSRRQFYFNLTRFYFKGLA